MKIAGWQKESFIDYEGKVSTLVFTSRCQYNCPACHAKKIRDSDTQIPEKYIFDFLDARKGWIEGVVLCGNEPLLEPDLSDFASEIKKRGFFVKLDTNGEDYEKLKRLHKEKNIDYVAMDVKGPPQLYSKIVGIDHIDISEDVGKSIIVVSQFPDYEFRTTVSPILRSKGKIDFLTPEEIGETARFIYDCTGKKEHKYILQKFVSRTKGEILDDRLSRNNLPKDMWETSGELMKRCLIEAKKYLPAVRIRNE